MDLREKDGSISIPVRVIPRASRNEIAGEHDGALKVRIKAPPVDGAANAELVSFLAKALKVPKSALEVVSGAASRSKTIRVSGLTKEAAVDLRKRLLGLPAGRHSR